MKKKLHHRPAMFLLGLSLLTAAAQDTNPFVKKLGANPSTPPPPRLEAAMIVEDSNKSNIACSEPSEPPVRA